MSRPKRDATGRVRGIGGLMTIRHEAGQLHKDGRRVLLRIEPTSRERKRFGDTQATARKLRMLADTLIRHADTIQKVRGT